MRDPTQLLNSFVVGIEIFYFDMLINMRSLINHFPGFEF